jgi:hypothetical protein
MVAGQVVVALTDASSSSEATSLMSAQVGGGGGTSSIVYAYGSSKANDVGVNGVGDNDNDVDVDSEQNTKHPGSSAGTYYLHVRVDFRTVPLYRYAE